MRRRAHRIAEDVRTIDPRSPGDRSQSPTECSTIYKRTGAPAPAGNSVVLIGQAGGYVLQPGGQHPCRAIDRTIDPAPRGGEDPELRRMLPLPAAFSNRTSGKISRGHGSRIEPHCGRRPLGAGHRRTEVCLYLRTGNIGGHEPPSLGSAQTDQAARSGLFDRGSCDRARDCPGDSDHRGGTDDGAASWLLSKPAHLR